MIPYDVWKLASPPESGIQVSPTPCPLCTGHDDAEPCSPECESLIRRAACIAVCRGLYAAARQALGFARMFEAEDRRDYSDPRNDHRIAACVAEVRRIRGTILALRWANRGRA